MDNELLLFDRIEAIKITDKKYDLEHNAYLSFSGGKDSTILHYLLDLALPNNRIPRVFINTGIEYQAIVEFVKELASKDDRFVIVQPSQPIKPTLEKYGYPFKSKEHSTKLHCWQIGQRNTKSIKKYMNFGDHFACPTILKYQFSDSFPLKISPYCCRELKKKPAHKWARQNNKTILMTGMRSEEGGQRQNLKGCILTDKDGNVTKFHPLVKANEEWENWFVEEQERLRGGAYIMQTLLSPIQLCYDWLQGLPIQSTSTRAIRNDVEIYAKRKATMRVYMETNI